MLSLSLPASPVSSESPASLSALVLADRFLAQMADRAGYTASASSLVGLAHTVFDERPRHQSHPLGH